MKTFFLIALCLSAFSYCTAQEISQAAINKNNQAIKVVRHHFNDKDSLEKAIRLFDEAINISPSYTLAYTNKAQYLGKLGKWKEALDAVEMAEKIEPSSPYICTTKGIYLEKNKNMTEARKTYQRAIDLFQERLKEKPQKESDFSNMLFTMFLRDNKILSLNEIKEIETSFGVKFNASDEEKFEYFYKDFYSKLDRESFMKSI